MKDMELIEKIRRLEKQVADLKEVNRELEKKYKEVYGAYVCKMGLIHVGLQYRNQMSSFNHLPWYKKMFFKFKIE